MEQAGPQLRGPSPHPHRGLSDKVAQTLWAIERIEQRKRRREESAALADSVQNLW
jgi:hypothetical protein